MKALAMAALAAAGGLACASRETFESPAGTVLSFHWHCQGPALEAARVDDSREGVLIDVDYELGSFQPEVVWARVKGSGRVVLSESDQVWTVSEGDCVPLTGLNGFLWYDYRFFAVMESLTQAQGCEQWPDLSGTGDSVLCAPVSLKDTLSNAGTLPPVSADQTLSGGGLGDALASLSEPERLRVLSVSRQPVLKGEAVPVDALNSLSGLEYLDLEDAGLVGPLPEGPFPNLKAAWLAGNTWRDLKCIPATFRGKLGPKRRVQLANDEYIDVVSDEIDDNFSKSQTYNEGVYSAVARYKYSCTADNGSPDPSRCFRMGLGVEPGTGPPPLESFEIRGEGVIVTTCSRALSLSGKIAVVKDGGACGSSLDAARFAEENGAIAVVFSAEDSLIGDQARNFYEFPDQVTEVSIPVFQRLYNSLQDPMVRNVPVLIEGMLIVNPGEDSAALKARSQRTQLGTYMGAPPYCDEEFPIGTFAFCAARPEAWRLALYWLITLAGLAAYVLTFGFATRLPHGSRHMIKATMLAAQVAAFSLQLGDGNLFAPTPTMEILVVVPVQALGLQPWALAKLCYCFGWGIAATPFFLQVLLFVLFVAFSTWLARKQNITWERVRHVTSSDLKTNSILPVLLAMRVFPAWFALPTVFMFAESFTVYNEYDPDLNTSLAGTWLLGIEITATATGVLSFVGMANLQGLVIADYRRQADTVREGIGRTSTLRALLPSEMRFSGVYVLTFISAYFSVGGLAGLCVVNGSTDVSRLVSPIAVLAVATLALRLNHTWAASAATSFQLLCLVAGLTLVTVGKQLGFADERRLWQTIAVALAGLVVPLGLLFAVLFRKQDSVLDKAQEDRLRLRRAAAGDTEAGAKVADIFRRTSTMDTLQAFHNALDGALPFVQESDKGVRNICSEIGRGCFLMMPCLMVLGVYVAEIRADWYGPPVMYSLVGLCACFTATSISRSRRDKSIQGSREGSDAEIKLVRVKTFRDAVRAHVRQHGRVPLLDEMNLQPEWTPSGEFAFISHKWFSPESADSPSAALTKALYLISGTSVGSSWKELGLASPSKAEKSVLKALKQAHLHSGTEWLWVDTFCVNQSSEETITADIRAIPEILLHARESVLLGFDTDVYCESFWCCVEAAFLSFRATPLIDLSFLEPVDQSYSKGSDSPIPVTMIDQSMLRFQTYRVESEIETLLSSVVRPLVETQSLTDVRWIKLAALYNALVQRANLLEPDADKRLPTFVRDGHVLLGQADAIERLMPRFCTSLQVGEQTLAQSTSKFAETGVDKTKRFVVRQPQSTPNWQTATAAQPVMTQPSMPQPAAPQLQPGQQIMVLTPEQVRALEASGAKVTRRV